jgi:hypothetical protein
MRSSSVPCSTSFLMTTGFSWPMRYTRFFAWP